MTGILVVAALATGAATLAGREPAVGRPTTVTVQESQERRGPDSTQVAAFLESLRATTPLVCEMISDQVGNFWFGERGLGIGRFADSRTEVRRDKEAITSEVRDPAAIRHLATRLGDDDPCVRLLAAKMLGNSTASDDLIGRLLDDRSPRVREAALRAAAGGERVSLRGRVERLLEEPDAAVGAMAAYALGEYEQRASVGPLRRALRHEAAPVRAAAAWALGQIEDAIVAPDLDALLNRETDRRVRIAAIEAIGDLDGLHVPPQSVVRAVSDPDRVVKVAAIEALVGFGEDTSLAPVLLPHITDEDPHVRLMIIEALGEMRLRSAVPAITRALRDPDPEVRRAAIEALAEIDDQ